MSGTAEQWGVYIGSLESGVTEDLSVQTDSIARYATPGYLLLHRDDSLFAQPFDLERRTVTGDPVRVTGGLTSITLTADSWVALVENVGFSTSDQGGLAYLVANASTVTELRWPDRSRADRHRISET